MSNKEERKAPVLRFKGFTDDWEQRKLGDIAKRVIRKNKENDILPVLTNSADLGIVLQNDYFDKAIAKNLNNYYIVSHNDFVYNPRISKKAPFGPINRNKLNIQGVMSPLYLVFRFNSEMDLNFLEYYFQSSKWYPFMYKNGDSGARADRFAIKNSVLMNMTINVPTLDQQKRIGKILLLLENSIALQQRKLKELKQIKGSLLTKILAGKNSNQPILRFRNFKNNWKQYRLKDLYTYSNGKAHEQSQQLNGKYELINLNSISIDGSLKSSGKYVNKSKDILKKNDLVMVLSDIAHGLLLGRVAVIPKDNKYVLNQRIALLRPQKNDKNSNFMASLINNNQSYFHRMGSGTSQLNISKSAVTESKWFIPEPDEQLAIGNLLKEIDNYIFLQQDKINQLTALRKFLSQNLFI